MNTIDARPTQLNLWAQPTSRINFNFLFPLSGSISKLKSENLSTKSRAEQSAIDRTASSSSRVELFHNDNFHSKQQPEAPTHSKWHSLGKPLASRTSWHHFHHLSSLLEYAMARGITITKTYNSNISIDSLRPSSLRLHKRIGYGI
jgi:hypothetical protein